MTLQFIMDQMQVEIDFITTLINGKKLPNAVRYKETARKLAISKYLTLLKKLNGEDLKRTKKSICDCIIPSPTFDRSWCMKCNARIPKDRFL